MVHPGLAQNQDQVIRIAPNSPVQTRTGSSVSAHKDSSCAGFIPEQPNYEVTLTEDMDRRFTVQGNSNITLLVINSKGKKFCVQADSTSNGKAEIPGRWAKDTYQVFIGTRSQGQNPYKLTIEPVN
ncbi:hypothetical protein ACN4EG_01020 [Alkalinema pantanalense CENA528]